MNNSHTNKNLKNLKAESLNWNSIQVDMKNKLGQDIYESWLKKINFIEEFIAQFNLDLRLSDYGINKKESDVILRDALGYMFRPIRQHEVIFDEKDLKKIIADCF